MRDANETHPRFSLAQSTPPTPGQETKLPFHIPVEVALLGQDGTPLQSPSVLELTEASQDFVFENVEDEPLPSVLLP